MPFAVYVPFYPGQAPNELLSREGDAAREAEYLSLAGEMISEGTFLALAPRDGWVLDAGCGGGRWLVRLQQAGCRMIGLDFDRAVLALVRTRTSQAPLVRGRADRLPFGDSTLAGLVSLGVVEHDPQGPLVMLREFARVLRPGGRLLVSVPFDNLLRRLWFNRRYRRRDRRLAGAAHQFVEFRFGRAELEEALRTAGFVPVACCPHEFRPPRNMSVVADRNMLAIHFEPTATGWTLRLPPRRGWELRGWWRWVVTALFQLSPWTVAGEILVVAEKAASSGSVFSRQGASASQR